MMYYYLCGNNCFNQINKTKITKVVDVELLSANDVIAVSLSWSRIVFLTERGRVIINGFISEGNESCLLLDSPNSTDPFDRLHSGWNATFLVTNAGKWFILIDGDQILKSTEFILSQSDKDVSITRIFTGEMHTLALSEAGHLYSARIPTNRINSESYSLILHPIFTATQIIDVDCGKEHVLLLTNLKTVCSFGLGSRGQLGHGGWESEASPRVVEALEGLNIHQVAAGGWHSMALSDCGDVYVWGWNESGQLGLSPPSPRQFLKRSSDNEEPLRKKPFLLSQEQTSEKDEKANILFKAEPTLLDFSENSVIVKIGCGSRHSAAVTDDGQLFTWGWNDYGQLGLNHRDKREQPALVEQLVDVQNVTCSYWNTAVLVNKL